MLDRILSDIEMGLAIQSEFIAVLMTDGLRWYLIYVEYF